MAECAPRRTFSVLHCESLEEQHSVADDQRRNFSLWKTILETKLIPFSSSASLRMSAVATRSALRRLIRAKNAAFKDDHEMLAITQQTIRQQFLENRDAPAEKVPQLLEGLEEAIEFLSKNIVQAPLNDRGNYAVDAARVNDPRKR